jgi:hypothetical protein
MSDIWVCRRHVNGTNQLPSCCSICGHFHFFASRFRSSYNGIFKTVLTNIRLCNLLFLFSLMTILHKNNTNCTHVFWGRFLVYFPYFEKIKIGLWYHHVLCVHVCLWIPPPQQLFNAWTSLYETWNAYHGTWAYLNGVLPSQQSLCVCMCMPLSLLGNGSVKT